MSMTVPLPPPGFEDLSPQEQLDYLQALWEHLSAAPDRVPVPEWQLRLLEERLRDDELDPRSWEEIRDDILRRLDGGG